jgi:hypothetical protein
MNKANKDKTMVTKRKTNARRKTAMVFNPSPAGRVLAGGSRINPTRKRRHHHRGRRRNPVSVTASRSTFRRRNPRRVTNPSSLSGLLVASVMAGFGISIFDILTSKFVPRTSPLLRIGTKLGGAYLFQSGSVSKVPVLGKYANEIALVLGVSAAVDAIKLWVLPAVTPTLQQFGLAPSATQVPLVDASDLGNIYGNSYAARYQPYS